MITEKELCTELSKLLGVPHNTRGPDFIFNGIAIEVKGPKFNLKRAIGQILTYALDFKEVWLVIPEITESLTSLQSRLLGAYNFEFELKEYESLVRKFILKKICALCYHSDDKLSKADWMMHVHKAIIPICNKHKENISNYPIPRITRRFEKIES